LSTKVRSLLSSHFMLSSSLARKASSKLSKRRSRDSVKTPRAEEGLRKGWNFGSECSGGG
jgi:hypothetical protein